MSPCGFIVDLLKSCYRAPVRFWEDDPRTTEVTWYFVPKTRPVLPFPTAFGSQQWEADGIGERRVLGTAGIGEQVASYYPWYNGRDIWGAPALRVCGSREEWANGGSGVPPGPPVSGLVPACCWLFGPPHAVSDVLTLTLTVEAARYMRTTGTGTAALALAVSGVSSSGRQVTAAPVLTLDAEALRTFGASRVALPVLTLQATAARSAARSATFANVLSLLVSVSRKLVKRVTTTNTLKLVVVTSPTTGGIKGYSPGCSFTARTPQKVSLVIAGATNGTCSDCANINGTWTLTNSPGSCAWTFGSVTTCGATTPIAFACLAGNVVQVTFGSPAMQFTATLASPWDGVSTLTLNRVTNTRCNLPATCTVTPL